jgi:hypothetical protein
MTRPQASAGFGDLCAETGPTAGVDDLSGAGIDQATHVVEAAD